MSGIDLESHLGWSGIPVRAQQAKRSFGHAPTLCSQPPSQVGPFPYVSTNNKYIEKFQCSALPPVNDPSMFECIPSNTIVTNEIHDGEFTAVVSESLALGDGYSIPHSESPCRWR